MTDWVFDSSAVLADMRNEPGAEVVRAAVASACISVVNASEVVAKLIDRGSPPDVAQEMLLGYPCEVIDAGELHGLHAGRLRAITRSAGLSLGDRFCLALALDRGLPVLTSDWTWARLNLGVEIQLIR